ncbi:MAG: ABC transporter permease [Patescibacteria group bacterium]|nr:ABC transporter permease [Patescibacteria group bacterium]
MKEKIKGIKNITLSAMKMYFRDRQAIFWSLFLPVMIMSIFGVMKFDQVSKVNLGLVDNAKNQASESLVENIKKVNVLNIKEGSEGDEKQALEKGDRDMVLILPKDFGTNLTPKPVNALEQQPVISEIKPTNLEIYYNEGKQDRVQLGTTALNQIFDRYTHTVTKTPDLFILDQKPIASRNLSYVDFLIPGIVAMGIMQMSVMGVLGAVVNWREKGIFKRLLATPIHPSVIIISQVLTRLIISVLQVATIIALGVVVFKVHFIGNPLLILLLAVLGGILFLNIGFALSSFGKTHQTVMALANIVMMPMMFLSGIFFPRETLPELLGKITQYLPLTYLAHGMRVVMIEGYNLSQIRTDVLGLLVWIVIIFFISTRVFRWE